MTTAERLIWGRTVARCVTPITEHGERRALGPLAHHLLEQPHGVRVGAAARVVLAVGQDHRPTAAARGGHGMGHGLGRPPDPGNEPAFPLAGVILQRIGRISGRFRAFGIGHHRGPAVPGVGRAEAAGEGQAGDLAPFERREPVVEALGRLVQGAQPAVTGIRKGSWRKALWRAGEPRKRASRWRAARAPVSAMSTWG